MHHLIRCQSRRSTHSEQMQLTFLPSRSVDRDLEWFRLYGEKYGHGIAAALGDPLDVKDGWLYALSGDQVKIVNDQKVKELIDRKLLH